MEGYQQSPDAKGPTSLRRWWPSFQVRSSERVRLPMGLMVTSRARSMVSGITKYPHSTWLAVCTRAYATWEGLQ